MITLHLTEVFVHDAENNQTFTTFKPGRNEVGEDVATWTVPTRPEGIEFLEQYRGKVVMVRDPDGTKVYGELDSIDQADGEVTFSVSIVEWSEGV